MAKRPPRAPQSAVDVEALRRENERLRGIISEYRHAETALRQTQEHLRAVVEHAPIVVFALDRDGVFTLSEGHGLGALGLKPGQVVGRSAFEIYKDTPQIVANLRRCLAGESVNEVVHVDDQVFEALYTPLLDASGAVTGVSGIAWDVTKRVHAEEAAKGLEGQLQHAQKMETIGTLAGGIAHDFNNILSPILGYTDIAMGLLEENHPARMDLREVMNATGRARELVQQILIFARGGDQQRRAVQLHLVVLETLRLIRATMPSTIEISQRVATRQDVVMADPTQMHQVIMNLCTNAAHSMRATGGVMRVELERRDMSEPEAASVPGLRPGSYVVLTVRDQGEGMDEATKLRIFEPFFTTKAQGEGTGLGLSVAHGIVRGHEGVIDLESVPGAGSTFRVFLPAIEAPGGTPPSPDARPGFGDGERILVVDDEPEIVRMLTRILEARGYRVTGHVSAHDALTAVRRDPGAFDAVITDQTMPKMSGTDLAHMIRETRPDMPIVLTSGYGEKTASETPRTDITAVAAKPFDVASLVEILRSALDAN